METTPMVQRLLLLICAFTSVAAAQSAPPRKAPPRKDVTAIAKAASGSVVSIVMSDDNGKPIVQGSGFFVSKDGVVVTNYHVISEGSSAVAKLPDGAFYLVDGVLASDKVRDIAFIKAHGQNFRRLTLGNSDRLQTGQEIVAIGNPLSLESTVSNGIVSGIRAIKKEGGNYLQITAPISPGSSGGPLFNMAGEVIGITTLYLKGGENLNFAIPINDIKKLLAATNGPSVPIKSFPNEKQDTFADAVPAPEPDKTNVEAACKEQAATFEHFNKSTEGADAAQFVSHFDLNSRTCLIEVGSYKMLPTGPTWRIYIYNALSEGEEKLVYGQFSYTVSAKPLNVVYTFDCRILDPPMRMSTSMYHENGIKCRSKEEFDYLALKHFGIAGLTELPSSPGQ